MNNNNTASKYMDKQIMDLTNSQTSATANTNTNTNASPNNDFIDFMNRDPEKKEGIVPSYDFMPIRSTADRSSSPPAARTSNFDSGDDDAPLRTTWNSADSKTNSSPIRNYGSLDADEPSKFILGKNSRPTNASSDVSLVFEVDKIMKKYVDNLMHAVDSMSARLTQLETRTRNLENSIDDLKMSVADGHGSTDGKMRLLENILREVQSGVVVIKDKQEILDAQLQISKLQVSKAEPEESKSVVQSDSTSTVVATANQQFSNVPPAQPQPQPNFPMPNAPPQQNLQSQLQLPNQFPHNQLSSIPQQDPYFSPPNQTTENPGQQYQIPPLQLHQPNPPPPQHQPNPSLPQHQPAPPPLQHQSTPQPQPQSAPPPQHQFQPPPPSQYPQAPTPSQPHPPFSVGNTALPQTPIGHHPEDTPYVPPQPYPPTVRPPTSLPPTGPPPPNQQYYGPSPSIYEPSNRPGPGYSGSFGPSSGHVEPYSYSNSPSQYGSSSPMKPQQQHPAPGMGQSGGSGYPQLPTARILPQALPTANAVSSGSGSGSGSSGSANRVPIDDVVDRVTNMGFPREQVRATVRRLTENGQAVDLNVVLDKLMNDGDGQGGSRWFGR
ncbi:uncharacterized protein LOC127241841 [Andrographis paniculata]|uniref:uncharacterized protein LOC127241841 n=1 Tax=Andrographis paniculata TaxID=175694 RepID=UPI0021E6F4D4|nr:uncharacterized protein LOC127241841 [Andrographis paniculata]